MYLPLIKKLQNIISKIIPLSAIILLLAIWQICCMVNILPRYMLPSPVDVIKAFIEDFPLLLYNSKATLYEAFAGLGIGILLGFVMASVMEAFKPVYSAFYPLLIITQTVPTVAIAPLLVLWLGYGSAPKVTLIVIVTFFPIAIGLLDGFKEADKDEIKLLKSMGANKFQIFTHIKLPGSLSHFFASLRMSVSYAIVGAVIAEWLGGFSGLGVYMTRVKKSYAYDKMFAVIFLITFISLILMKLVDLIQYTSMPWNRIDKKSPSASGK